MRAFAIIILAVCSGCSTVAVPSISHPSEVVPVEVFTGGDDGLTQRLGDAIRSEFAQSARFTLTPSSAHDALRVTIPTNVDWKQVGGKTRVTFQLSLQRSGRNIGKIRGQCWEDDLSLCAHEVLGAATRAVKF